MANGKKRAGRPASGAPRAVRASVSLQPDLYRTLQDLANQRKVSTAWIIRDAIETYVAEQWPLLEKRRR
jgi:metal-responsive CopG/Arc/MetJ family transcriptional regulator